MFPIRDNIPSRTTPYVTYSLIALNLVIFALELGTQASAGALQELIGSYGLTPARYTADGWAHFSFIGQLVPFISYQFLHGGIMHLVGNLWMLWIFGDNVEDWFGHFWFVLFYLGCGLASGMLHILVNWNSMMPVIGASGSISGVMGAYVLLYPHARVKTLIFLFIIITWIDLPAYFFLGIWFLKQLLGGMGPSIGSDVAWWAHIGGFIAGAGSVLALGGGGPLKKLLTGGLGASRKPDERPQEPKQKSHRNSVDDHWD